MSSIPTSYFLRLLPKLKQLGQERPCWTSIEDVFPGLIGIDVCVVDVSQEPVRSQLDTSVTRRGKRFQPKTFMGNYRTRSPYC